jgi:PPOX class probable F420-dependent enzyme
MNGTPMKFIPISDAVRELLDGPNYAHLTTLMTDGSPRNHVVWVWREDDRIIVATSTGHFKAQDMDRDPRVSISLINQEDPYQMAALRGEVVEVRPHDGLKLMDRISHKYTSNSFPDRQSELSYYVIAVRSAYERKLGGLVHQPAHATGMSTS